MGKVSSSEILNYFSDSSVLEHYQEATEQVGLWDSEKIVFSKTFPDLDLNLLELGCGTGRISFGLWKRGYTNLMASDFSKPMIKRARILDKKLKTEITFQVEDATALSFSNDSFDGAIFGFNGLMQIPGRKNRFQAMQEIQRVLKPGSFFVFTTHDQSMPKWKKFWALEQKNGKKENRIQNFWNLGTVLKKLRGASFIFMFPMWEIFVRIYRLPVFRSNEI